MERARAVAQKMVENVKRVIIGKDGAVELGLISLMCQGHVLIEDVPGVGKTMLARSLARSCGGSFRRIQFTPDLLPSDITGVSIYNQKLTEFEFKRGPIFAQVVLADEINRATPKTQSALLEAMEERQVTVEGVTHPVPRPFTVMATQNPVEYEGTFPLPEAQLDRFLLMITLGYPSAQEELRIIDSQQSTHPIESLQPVAAPEDIVMLHEASKSVFVDDLVKQYVVTLVERTRSNEDITLGCSPRGTLALIRTCQALALVRGRDFVLPDDVKELAVPVMAHRIIVSAAARMRGVRGAGVIAGLVDRVPVPGAHARSAAGR
ncbi:MAG: MoxR family ATPase [SAR202 cluster bacterium]|nr:MoxR family ATPase [SAR202 cluster bacterium]